MHLNKTKRAFTLIELIIVISLIFVTYFLVFSNSNFKVKNNEVAISLNNLQEILIKNFQFNQDISFVCIEENFECFIKIDGILEKMPIVKNFFKTKPSVYEYNKESNLVEFRQIKINNTNQNIIFELKISSDYKINEFILDKNLDIKSNEKKVYIFNALFKEPQVVASLNEVITIFKNNEIEVKNAF
ncbi:MAG: type II secretion system protein [Arcobacteraceae bacterium]